MIEDPAEKEKALAELKNYDFDHIETNSQSSEGEENTLDGQEDIPRHKAITIEEENTLE